jgi:hypothetical protein
MNFKLSTFVADPTIYTGPIPMIMTDEFLGKCFKGLTFMEEFKGPKFENSVIQMSLANTERIRKSGKANRKVLVMCCSENHQFTVVNCQGQHEMVKRKRCHGA